VSGLVMVLFGLVLVVATGLVRIQSALWRIARLLEQAVDGEREWP
jgi:hypothetical protein